MSRYVTGLDFGTNSRRSLLVDVSTGEEVASHVYAYPGAKQYVGAGKAFAKEPVKQRKRREEFQMMNLLGPEDAPFSGAKAFQYRLEVSEDGKAWKIVVDMTSNAVTRYTEFDDFRPTPARYVHLTLTDWPHSASQPLGVVEFTVFGKLPSGRAPGPQ